MKFSIKDFFSKCDQIHRKPGHIYWRIFNGKLHFLYRAYSATSDAPITAEYQKR